MSMTETNDALPAHKPAFLKRVQIRNYKSIAFCDVTLEPLTLLVGRNGSGKSNFLDALGFLADLMSKRVSEALEPRGGWNSVFPKYDNSGKIEFQVTAAFTDDQKIWKCEYSISIEKSETGRIRINYESLDCTSVKPPNDSFGFELSGGELHWHVDPRIEAKLLFGKMGPSAADLLNWFGHERSILGVLATNPFNVPAEILRYSRVYNFSPAAIRHAKARHTIKMLENDGANLADIVALLSTHDSDRYQRAIQYLRSIVPGVDSFNVRESQPGYKYLSIKMHAAESELPIELFTDGMSDGTIRVLASLIAASQNPIHLSEESVTVFDPGFIGIEEPETSLHPAAVSALIDALDEATLRTQIILTTHSSDILDNPTIKPENVRVVRMIDGRTVIAPVDKVYHDIIRRELNTLGGLERENQLEPDFDDLERQQKLADAPREAAA